jgi:diaminopimelate decarboxylase
MLKKQLKSRVELLGQAEGFGQVEKAIAQKKAILESCSEHKTPQYLLDEAELQQTLQRFTAAFSYARGFYAFKCNELPWILALMKKANFGADVAGLFELRQAVELGFEPIIFTAPFKTDEELLYAIEHNAIINIDNLDELERVKGLGSARISFRIKNSAWTKFGIELEKLRQAVESAEGLTWVGLHFHSSWNPGPKSYIENLKRIGEYLKANFSNQELGKLKFIDIGGGFVHEAECEYLCNTEYGKLLSILGDEYAERAVCISRNQPIEAYAKQIRQGLSEHIFPLLRGIEVWVEPGRYLVEKSTSILLRVEACKGRDVITDGGINLIGDCRADFEYFPIVNLTRPSKKLQKGIVYGPLCDPNDLWGFYYYGEPCQKNDVLCVLNQGAYTYALAWKFIKPIAQYISLRRRRTYVAKTAEGFKERFGNCRLP